MSECFSVFIPCWTRVDIEALKYVDNYSQIDDQCHMIFIINTFTRCTRCNPQTLVTGFSTDPNEKYCVLYSSKLKEGINIYAYIHLNPKITSHAKGLKCDAGLVSYGAIVDPKETRNYVSSDDVHIYAPYVRSLDIHSAFSQYLRTQFPRSQYMNLRDLAHDVKSILDTLPLVHMLSRIVS